MNELVIENDAGFVLQTEQWDGDVFIVVADGPPADKWESKSILLDVPRVRQLVEWLAVWLAQHEDDSK